MPDHTAVTNALLYALTHAYCEGEKVALSLRVGDVFLGAYGSSMAAGYEEHSLECASFVSGFMQGLETTFIDGDTHSKRRIVVNSDNIIVSVKDNP